MSQLISWMRHEGREGGFALDRGLWSQNLSKIHPFKVKFENLKLNRGLYARDILNKVFVHAN